MSVGWLRVAVLMTGLSGCALTVSDPRALVPMEGFVALASDPRVGVEPGFEAYGERVAQVLPRVMARVEAAHYLPFVSPPRIYVCGTQDCFNRHVLTPKLSAAVVPDNRLILSPNLDNEREKDRLEPLLTHELAHLHLGQRIGHYHTTLPVWFHEGWASLTAGGGGAEYASDEQAIVALREGRRIDLDRRDTPDKRHRAQAFHLNIHEFYRQAMLLVGWLKRQNEARFKALALAIQDNQDFEIAFWDVYGASPAVALEPFFMAVQNGDNVGAAPFTSVPFLNQAAPENHETLP